MVTPRSEQLSALEQKLARLAGEVPDPELPVISLAELGVLRGVHVLGPGRVRVELTPTWIGCPALEAMAADITRVLTAHGVTEVAVKTVLSPAWSSDSISPEGRRKLAEAGVAPPRPQGTARDARWTGPGTGPSTGAGTGTGPGPNTGPGTGPATGAGTAGGVAEAGAGPVAVDLAIHCPNCGSTDTRLVSRFSSTACKALRRCESCREPFDHFKEV